MRRGAIVLLLALFAGSGSAQEKPKLERHFVMEPIRVFYSTEGAAAVSPEDSNENGVPDRVEDIARQAWAAHDLFCGVLDFPDPLESERYPGVTCIQISVVPRERIKDRNGVAYRVAQRARSIPEGSPEDRAIVAAVALNVDPRKNLTPAHEVFHLIQYGATFFGNRWYLEGMARWSEQGLGKGGLKDAAIVPRFPQRDEDRDRLYRESYEAARLFWNPLVERVGGESTLPSGRIGERLAGLTYTDGSPVLADRDLSGAAFMRSVLLELGRADDRAFRELGYGEWKLDKQNSKRNDPHIYNAVMDVLRNFGSQTSPTPDH